MRKAMRFARYAHRYAIEGNTSESCITPLPQDHRFVSNAWQKWPYVLIYQAFLLQQQWWHNATTGVRGVSKGHEAMVEFGVRQILDMFAPSNFPLMNPDILWRTINAGGLNLATGFQNLLEDWERVVGAKGPVGVPASLATAALEVAAISLYWAAVRLPTPGM
jgi:polyhydroxyalkanoate synthase subunit PhaC